MSPEIIIDFGCFRPGKVFRRFDGSPEEEDSRGLDVATNDEVKAALRQCGAVRAPDSEAVCVDATAATRMTWVTFTFSSLRFQAYFRPPCEASM
jgi:hypothetical protein